jgi:hypothetical protein
MPSGSLLDFYLMNRCILHFGFPKTGSSSIQKFLRHDLSETGFHYPVSAEHSHLLDDCHNRPLCCAFVEKPENYHMHVKEGIGLAEIRSRGEWFKNKLHKSLGEGFFHTLILSAEDVSHYQLDELRALSAFLTSMGLATEPLAYLRNFKASAQSRFQQDLKSGFTVTCPINPDQSEIARSVYRFGVQKFDELFGADAVRLFSYDRVLREDGCILRHFCSATGITQTPQVSRRSNESLTLDAVRLLYAYRKTQALFAIGQSAIDANQRLVERLSGLDGQNLVFHSSLLLKHEQSWRADVEWISERLGEDMLENLFTDDGKDCLRGEEDLYRFSRESLDWLARETGVSYQTLKGGNPESVARAVERLKEPIVEKRSRRGFWGWLTGRAG